MRTEEMVVVARKYRAIERLGLRFRAMRHADLYASATGGVGVAWTGQDAISSSMSETTDVAGRAAADVRGPSLGLSGTSRSG